MRITEVLRGRVFWTLDVPFHSFLGQGFLPFSDSRLDPKLKFLIFTVGLYYSNLNFPHTCVIQV